MSLLSGVQSGLRSGVRSGIDASYGGAGAGAGADPMAGVTRDATSNVYMPATLGEWATARSAAGLSVGAVTSIWRLQDTSAGAVDVTGTNNLTAYGTVSYQNAVTGWSAKAIGMADGAAGAEIASTAASLPDLTTTSALVLTYIALPSAPAASRTIMGLGAVSYQTRVSTTPAFTFYAGANSAAGASNLSTSVRPHVLRHNITASTAMYCTDQEKVAPALVAATGKRIDLGGFDLAAPTVRYVYAAMFTGTAAELSDANVKSLLQVLGWVIPWS